MHFQRLHPENGLLDFENGTQWIEKMEQKDAKGTRTVIQTRFAIQSGYGYPATIVDVNAHHGTVDQQDLILLTLNQ